MYLWIWKHLQGSRRAKVLQALALAVVVIGVCFVWVFPVVSDLLPEQGVVVTGPTPDPQP